MPSPPFILNLSRPHLRKLPPLDVDVHGQLLKVGWVTCIVLVQFHNFLIGTLVLGLAEISIFPPLYLLFSSFRENVGYAFFTRMFSLSLFCHPHFLPISLYVLSPFLPSLSLGGHTQRFLFPVDVMSLRNKQSTLICQRSSRRFIKIQQTPTKDVHVSELTSTSTFAPAVQTAVFTFVSFA